MTRAAWSAVLLACVLLAGCGGDGDEDRSVPATQAQVPDVAMQQIVVGRGASAATVLRPIGGSRRPPGVVFVHGWGAVDPATYGAWARHLVAGGYEVILPRYQLGPVALPGQSLAAMLRGLRAALRRAPVEAGSLVVAGHSAGGAMSVDYAAVAGAHGLPQPCGVMAVYPGRHLRGIPLGIPRQDLARIPPATRVLALATEQDRVVGTATARDIVAGARRVPRERRRLVLVRDPAVTGHAAPQSDRPAARRAFWAPLDRLLERCRA